MCVGWVEGEETCHDILIGEQNDSLMFSAGTLTTAGSIRLSARTKAPSSRVSSSIVAVCVCSVEFMSSQDFRASGRRRLSTVSTMACIRGNKRNVNLLKHIFIYIFFSYLYNRNSAKTTGQGNQIAFLTNTE